VARVLSAAVFDQVTRDLEANYGKWLKTEAPVVEKDQIFTIYSYPVTLEKGGIRVRIIFDPNGGIAGFNVVEAVTVAEHDTEVTDLAVTFSNPPYEISGTLSLPEGEGPFPGMIIVHGSGPSDRRGTLLGNTPYQDLAAYLSDRGVAVLTYDKRTFTYGQTMDPDTTTPYEETIEDAVFAFDYLRNRDDILGDRIFLAGHSFGGYLMPLIARETPAASGYILISANNSPLEDLMVKQHEWLYRLDGDLSPEEEAALRDLSRQRDAVKALTQESGTPREELFGIPRNYWLFLKKYDPLKEVLLIEQPLLILQGERDYQVDILEFHRWQEVLGDSATYHHYPAMNHLLYDGQGPSGPEEYTRSRPLNEDLLKDIRDFISP
jgi:hypothetical protein